MRSLFLVASLLTYAVAMGDGASEDKPYQLSDTVVVTAERFAAPAKNVSWPVRTLTLPQEIHVTDLTEVLDGVSGIDLTGYGQTGHLSNLLIWGAPSSQILLLRNGRPVYNPATGGFNLAEFNPSELDRIEIVKGTQSSLYGSDAIGGVVNLITRKNYLNQYGGGFSVGSKGFLDYDLHLAKSLSDWHLNLLQKGALSNNDRSNSGFKKNTMGGEIFYSPEDKNWDGSISYRYFRDSVGLPGPVPDPEAIPFYGDGQSYSMVNHQRDFIHSLDAHLQIAPAIETPFSADINIFYEKRTLEYFGRYAYLGFANDSIDANDRNRNIGRNSGMGGRVRFDMGGLTVAGGLEFLSGSSRVSSSATTTTFNLSDSTSSAAEAASFRRHHRDIYAVWTSQSIFLHDNVKIDLSERLQLVNENDTYVALNAGIKFFPSDDWSLSVAYGSAFRLPAFNDLYWPIDEYSVGNPNLIPEKGNNIAVTVSGAFAANLTLNSSIFYRRVKDLISWAPLGEDNSYGSPRWTPSNLNRSRTLGVDFGLKYIPTRRWELEGEITVQSARQKNKELVFSSGIDGTQRFETVERDAAFVPQIKARAGAKAELARFSATLEAIYTSLKKAYFAMYSFDSQFNSLISYREKRLQESFVVNFGVHRPIGEIFDISLNINDIFDQKPAHQFGGNIKDGDYPSLGRNFNLALNFNIK